MAFLTALSPFPEGSIIMLVNLLLFPFGFFIVMFIGAYAGWKFMSHVKETENTCIDVACVFAIVAFCILFFASMTLQNPSLSEVLLSLLLCGLAGPIASLFFYILLAGGYHFRNWRVRMYKKLFGSKNDDYTSE